MYTLQDIEKVVAMLEALKRKRMIEQAQQTDEDDAGTMDLTELDAELDQIEAEINNRKEAMEGYP